MWGHMVFRVSFHKEGQVGPKPDRVGLPVPNGCGVTRNRLLVQLVAKGEWLRAWTNSVIFTNNDSDSGEECYVPSAV